MDPVIVTGAGKGLGRAIALKLIEDGFPIVAVDIENSLLSSLKSDHPGRIETQVIDVSNYSQVEQFFRETSGLAFSGLVNNAGLYKGKSIIAYSCEEINKLVDVNIKGAMYFSRFFGELMLNQKREGVIVNISSSSIYGGADPVYSATKAALVGLTKACAKVFSPYLRVNAVAPGIVNTDLQKDIPEEIMKWYRGAELVKKPLEPEDVANTVSFLFSERGQNYTGAVFDLNNGFHM